MKRVAIIGAGPAGLTAGLELAKRGFPVEIFEASPHLGGMARSFPLWGAPVDLGPHRFFSQDPRVNALWLDLAGPDHEIVDRLTRIFYRGGFFSYPLRPIDVLRRLGPLEATRCLASYAAQLARNQRQPKAAESFEDWVVAAFGRRLFEVFFKPYSEKLWGIPCDQLDVDFAAQRIQKFSLARACTAALGLEKRLHKTLVHQFPHPREGAGLIYQRMAERIQALGGTVHTNQAVGGISSNGHGLRLPSGEERSFEHIVSTMPLTTLCKSLPDLPENIRHALDQLRFRNTILIYLRVLDPALFPDQWLYIQSPEVRLGRVTNFRNWPNGRNAPDNASILALEYWSNDEGDLWLADDPTLTDLASREIRSLGLLGNAEIADAKVIRVPKCYPVYRRGYRTQLAEITRHLQARHPNITAIGRYGAFKYNNQDHSILMGILAAETISGEASHDLWSINTDYDTFQEAAAPHAD